MNSNSDQFYLVLPVIAAVVLAAVVAGLFYIKNRPTGFAFEVALVAVAGLAFVFLGAGAINTMTNRRGSPEETTPWLALTAIAGGVVYFRIRRRRLDLKPPTARKDVDLTAQRETPRPRAPLPRSATTAPSSPPPVQPSRSLLFISYRRSDSSDVTGRIYDRLVQHFGKDSVFKDVDSIPLGVDFRAHLSSAVGQCHILLAVIGRSWLGSDKSVGERRLDDPGDFVRIEIESAFERNVPVIPILVQQAGMPAPRELPASLQPLAYRNAIPVRSDPDFHQDVGRLIKGIEAHLHGTTRKFGL